MKDQLKLLILAAIIGISSITYADMHDGAGKHRGKRTPEARIEKHLERIKKQLNISDVQETQIRAVLTNTKDQIHEKMAKLKSAPDADKAAIRNELKSMRLSTQNEILRILTPEQRVKAESLLKERKAKMKDKHKKMRSHQKG